MPKKRFTPNLDPMNHSSRPKPSSSNLPARTVNERIALLRAEQTPRPTLEQRQNVETVATSRSRPPELNSILNIPETAPPAPRPGSRRLRHLRRAPPGPAAPRSWLSASLHAPAHVKAYARRRAREDVGRSAVRDRPDGFQKLVLLEGGHHFPQSGSLIDQALKSMASEWDFVAGYEQHNLPTLPIPLKTFLLSYLGVYGPESIRLDDLKLLFRTEKEIGGGTGCEEISRLDLSGFLGPELTLGELAKYFVHRRNDRSGIPSQAKALPEATLGAQNHVTNLLESWEDDPGASSIPNSLTPLRFPHLTHLSLASAGNYASWSALLSLSSYLSTLTHLSLAYWPVPTMAPPDLQRDLRYPANSLLQRGEDAKVVDWHESANILRRISNNTYCLRWLDLEGCNDWLPALIWKGEIASSRGTQWAEKDVEKGPDWNGSWAQVKYVNVSQGFIPTDTKAVQSIPASVVACDLLLYLREHDEAYPEGQGGPLYGEELSQWFEREKIARSVASTVRLTRVMGKGPYCVFDYGWAPPTVIKEKGGKG